MTQDCTTNKELTGCKKKPESTKCEQQQPLTGCEKKPEATKCEQQQPLTSCEKKEPVKYEKKQELKSCEKKQDVVSAEKRQESTATKQQQKLTECKITTDEKTCKALKKDLQMTLKNDNIKKVADIKGQATNLMSKAVGTLSKNSAATQLVVGSVAGWTTGFLTMKLGRTTAFVVGGSIIAFQIAQNTGYVKTDWDKVRQKVKETSQKFDATLKYKENSPKLVASASRFARSNTCFAAGFIGGFLIGLAS